MTDREALAAALRNMKGQPNSWPVLDVLIAAAQERFEQMPLRCKCPAREDGTHGHPNLYPRALMDRIRAPKLIGTGLLHVDPEGFPGDRIYRQLTEIEAVAVLDALTTETADDLASEFFG